VFGIPAFLVLRWRRWNSMMAYFAAGAVVGVLLCLASAALVAIEHIHVATIDRQARGLWPFLIACTLASSSVFWMIVRPDTFGTPSPKAPTPPPPLAP
jgi:drug/metabolite transporter (DMT)-like permease